MDFHGTPSDGKMWNSNLYHPNSSVVSSRHNVSPFAENSATPSDRSEESPIAAPHSPFVEYQLSGSSGRPNVSSDKSMSGSPNEVSSSVVRGASHAHSSHAHSSGRNPLDSPFDNQDASVLQQRRPLDVAPLSTPRHASAEFGHSGQLQLPTDVDQSAYMLGQRAAFQQCFREALPHQQTLGALQAVIADMRSSSDQFDGRLRAVEQSKAGMHEAIKGTQERLGVIERDRLSQLEAELASTTGHMRAELQHMKHTLALAIEASRQDPNMQALLAGCGRQVLRTMWGATATLDQAAGAMAHRLLCDRASQNTGQQVSGRVRALLGVAMLLAAVEASWRTHRAVASRAGKHFQAVTAPLGASLRYSRIALWTAVFVVSSVQLKQACYLAADAVPNYVSACLAPLWPPSRALWPPLWTPPSAFLPALPAWCPGRNLWAYGGGGGKRSLAAGPDVSSGATNALVPGPDVYGSPSHAPERTPTAQVGQTGLFSPSTSDVCSGGKKCLVVGPAVSSGSKKSKSLVTGPDISDFCAKNPAGGAVAGADRHSGSNIQGTFREHSGNVHGAFNKALEALKETQGGYDDGKRRAEGTSAATSEGINQSNQSNHLDQSTKLFVSTT